VSARAAPSEWDAETYHRVSDLQLEWGREVLDRLPLSGDETVLDAGCGSGRVTELLVARLPKGRVIAVDASEAMVEKARETLGDRAEVRVANLAELELDEHVDAVFSNAVFHWIHDHERLFARIHAALRPGGRLIAQCGGKGNVAPLTAAIREVGGEPPFDRYLDSAPRYWYFATPEDTAARLRDTGLEQVHCWAEPKVDQPEDPIDFLESVSLGPYIMLLPEDLRRPFVEAVVDRMSKPVTLAYVRLNIDARRPSTGG
jgi:trans-aconitate 2-methyltransferase